MYKLVLFIYLTNLKSSPESLEDTGCGLLGAFLFFLLSSYKK